MVKLGEKKVSFLPREMTPTFVPFSMPLRDQMSKPPHLFLSELWFSSLLIVLSEVSPQITEQKGKGLPS